MKELNYENEQVFIGTAQEIETTYQAMNIAWNNDESEVKPLYWDEPKLNHDKYYGIEINLEDNTFQVISETRCMDYLLGGKGNGILH